MADAQANAVVLAAARWLFELRASSPDRAQVALTTEPRYRDLTATQYAAAWRWLTETGLAAIARMLPDEPGIAWSRARQLVLQEAIRASDPLWLADAASLVSGPQAVPADVERLAELLGVTALDAFVAARAAGGKVDTAHRELVGSAGEAAFVEVLRDESDCAVDHVALAQDGLGYDVLVAGTVDARFEVKSTTRRGALTVYLSRNEFEVMQADSCWHLVVVFLDHPGVRAQALAVGTVERTWIESAVPADRAALGRWDSVRLAIPQHAVRPGVPVLTSALRPDARRLRGHLPEDPPHWLSGDY